MKLPRDVTGADLIKRLSKLGYVTTRQTGSHIRLTTIKNGQHHTTIPNHDPLRIGTFSSIISDIAIHFNLRKEDILKTLFED